MQNQKEKVKSFATLNPCLNDILIYFFVFVIVVPFVHGKTFHPNLIFVIRVDHISDAANVY